MLNASCGQLAHDPLHIRMPEGDLWAAPDHPVVGDWTQQVFGVRGGMARFRADQRNESSLEEILQGGSTLGLFRERTMQSFRYGPRPVSLCQFYIAASQKRVANGTFHGPLSEALKPNGGGAEFGQRYARVGKVRLRKQSKPAVLVIEPSKPAHVQVTEKCINETSIQRCADPAADSLRQNKALTFNGKRKCKAGQGIIDGNQTKLEPWPVQRSADSKRAFDIPQSAQQGESQVLPLFVA